jgi:hypothetical protein
MGRRCSPSSREHGNSDRHEGREDRHISETRGEKWVCEERLPDGRIVAIELREGMTVSEGKTFECQAGCVVAGPHSAGSATKEILMRGGEYDELEESARGLTPEELGESADKPAA